MERVHALPRIVAALAAMNACLKRCVIDAIPSTRNFVLGRERTMILSCFPCRRSTQPWPTFDNTSLLCRKINSLSCPTPCGLEGDHFLKVVEGLNRVLDWKLIL